MPQPCARGLCVCAEESLNSIWKQIIYVSISRELELYFYFSLYLDLVLYSSIYLYIY